MRQGGWWVYYLVTHSNNGEDLGYNQAANGQDKIWGKEQENHSHQMYIPGMKFNRKEN